MTTADTHLSMSQLQLLLDGRMNQTPAMEARAHLAECHTCRNAASDLARIDAGLRRLPVGAVGRDFTREVLARAGVIPRSPLLFRLAEHAAYLFGLLVVVAAMTAVFIVTGVVSVGEVKETGGLVRQLLDGTGSLIAGAVGSAVARSLDFAVRGGGSTITLTLLGVVAVLALADRLWGRKVLGRSSQLERHSW